MIASCAAVDLASPTLDPVLTGTPSVVEPVKRDRVSHPVSRLSHSAPRPAAFVLAGKALLGHWQSASATTQSSPRLYMAVLAVWLGLLAASGVPLVDAVTRALHAGAAVATMVIASTGFIAYFWLNGLKDIAIVLYFQRHRQELLTVPPPSALSSDRRPQVLLLYTTCDDFDEDSLSRSMGQTYPACCTVILDDSKGPAYLHRIDSFAARRGLTVVRRRTRAGFKAGNLNHFLRIAAFDYFVLLDSDEIIPPDFVERALPYFADPGVGIVQANHISSREENAFMRRFGPGVASHWITYQSVKARFGFLSLLGHGAMVSKDCYAAAGGFPPTVAEDLAFSLMARCAGYRTAFAAAIVCEETFPVTYSAFKKRHVKWTAGNLDFIRRYTGTVLFGPLHWYEKLDIILFTYSLPLTAFFVAYLVINALILPAMGFGLRYPVWLLLPTLVFLAAPLLNDFLHYRSRWHWSRLLVYVVSAVALYGSMFATTIWATATTLARGANFVVTPKVGERVGWRTAIRLNWRELSLACVLLVGAQICAGTILPCLLIGATAASGPYLVLLGNF